MALGAVLLSVPLAILAVGILWASIGIHVFYAILIYALLGTFALIAVPLMATVIDRDD